MKKKMVTYSINNARVRGRCKASMKGQLRNGNNIPSSSGLEDECGWNWLRLKKDAGKSIRTYKGGINGDENRGVFAGGWYFGSL